MTQKSTKKTYISWIKHHIAFNDKYDPADRRAVEVEGFLTHLANELHVSYTIRIRRYRSPG
ncbi:hypothetical protein W03_05410 [Nitrosomonas sp. PY1]|uniref:phage integrase N-terminal SAM-like domain-containing protein n=1 Tax=Nitrosomonas sp. PY1 TaxID=1803906 RepID=UPI002085875B|nr:hypothetical protein W03_05410 [Nitrosomonas sp. PY1]